MPRARTGSGSALAQVTQLTHVSNKPRAAMGQGMAAGEWSSGAPSPGALDWELLATTLGPGAARLLACSGSRTSASSSSSEAQGAASPANGGDRDVGGASTGEGGEGPGAAATPPQDARAHSSVPSAEMLQLIRSGRFLEALLTPPAQALLHWPAREGPPTAPDPPGPEGSRNLEAPGAASPLGNGTHQRVDPAGPGGGAGAAAGVERGAELYLQCVRLRVSLLVSAPAELDVPCVSWGVGSCATGGPGEERGPGGGPGQECENARVALLAGVACLMLFTQANVTGPFPHDVPAFPTRTRGNTTREEPGGASESYHEGAAGKGSPSCSCWKAFSCWKASSRGAGGLWCRQVLQDLPAAPGPECELTEEPASKGLAASGAPGEQQQKKQEQNPNEGQEPEQAHGGGAGTVSEEAAVEQWATSELMGCADGTDIVGTCRLPQYLLLARELLQVGAQAGTSPLSEGLVLDVSGLALWAGNGHSGHSSRRDAAEAAGQAAEIGGAARHGPHCGCPAEWSWQWWRTRALLLHQRMLAERSPSLRAALLRSCPPLLRGMDALREGLATARGPVNGSAAARLMDEACAGAYVEVGLMELAYAHVDSARRLFETAGRRVGWQGVQITGALGYRTVHQVDPKPQLVLHVQRAALAGGPAAPDLVSGPGDGQQGRASAEGATVRAHSAQGPSSDFDPESDVLLVPRLVGPPGDVATSSAHTSQAVGNGTHGTEAGSTGSAGGRGSVAGPGLQRLTPVEQLVVLALGSAAVKIAPHDEMRGWEVAPYVEAIYAQPPQAVPFMLRSAAAIQRVRWERGRLHTRQRALAAMTELIAAHGGEPGRAEGQTQGAQEKTQPTAQETELLERLPYALSVWFPLSCSLSKEYGELLLACGCVGEALGVFEAHQQWESVILCYTLLQKSTAASALIHSRLKLFPNDPRLWCSLGDLNNDAECYQKAWQVSKGRFGRAQRALARLAQNRKDYAGAVGHWELALRINPLHPGGWFSLGYAAMQVGDVGKALHALTRSVQLDPENGEAWNNIAALNMRRKRFPEALTALQEGLKHKADSWHMWENLAQVALEVAHRGPAPGKPSDSHQELVLLSQALRAADKAWGLSKGRRADLAVLGRLVQEVEQWRGTGASAEARGQAKGQETQQGEGDGAPPAEEDAEEDEWAEMPNATAALLQPIELPTATQASANGTGAPGAPSDRSITAAGDGKKEEVGEGKGGAWQQRQRAQVEADLRRLLSQVVASGCAGAEAWALQGRLLQALGDVAGAMEASLKHVRGLQGNGWQHNREKFQAFADASLQMADACLSCARKQGGGNPGSVVAGQPAHSQQTQLAPEKEKSVDVLKWLASTRMHLRSVVKQAAPHADVPQYQQLQEKLEDVSRMEDNLRS